MTKRIFEGKKRINVFAMNKCKTRHGTAQRKKTTTAVAADKKTFLAMTEILVRSLLNAHS
jgi:hypothetical protein